MVNLLLVVLKNENVENFNSISLISGFCVIENYNVVNLCLVFWVWVVEKRVLCEEVLMLEKIVCFFILFEIFFGVCFFNVIFD